MRILSLYFGHDSSICLLEDGEPVVVIEKERISRIRHDQGWMEVVPLLEAYRWSVDSIDLVAINPHLHPNRDGGSQEEWHLTGRSYTERDDYRAPGLRCPPEDRYSHHDVHLFGRTYPCVAIDHHLGHIATGFYTSPFANAAVLSADGGGDERTCAAAYGEESQIIEVEYGWGTGRGNDELNIGSVWGSVAQHYLGYGRLDGAGKLMGLAPYGTPRQPVVDAMITAAYADPYGPLPQAVAPLGVREDKDPFVQDLAASVQAFTTQSYLGTAERIAKLFGNDRLVLTGGCSMNCVANTAVHTSGFFDSTFVPAQPSDCGLALGQALFAWHHVLGKPRTPRAWSPYLGFDAGGAESTAVIESAVDRLDAGKTVGLCVGRAENGPRALGHRSIVADPRDPNITNVINSRIKRREWYRPFAPMVLEEDFELHFGPAVPSSYMGYVTQVTDPDLPGITHVDASTRPQVVGKDDHGVARALLEEWKRRSGIGVLLNTSLNCREPMVDSAAQAESTWRRSGLDVLVTADETFAK